MSDALFTGAMLVFLVVSVVVKFGSPVLVVGVGAWLMKFKGGKAYPNWIIGIVLIAAGVLAEAIICYSTFGG